MKQIQVRVPDELIGQIDGWVNEEREKTRDFYSMIIEREREVEEHPDILVPLEICLAEV